MPRRSVAVSAISALACVLGGCSGGGGVSLEPAVGPAGRAVVAEGHAARFGSFAVAADHAVASAAGAEILAAGGNAVDAAVATSFALSVVRPYSSGIGGGGFMVIRTAAGETVAIDYRETSPRGVGPDHFVRLRDAGDARASSRGGHAVATPGAVAGLLWALDTYGTMDLARVLAPAIRAAEQGFEVDAHYAESVAPLIREFRENPDYRTRFGFVWRRYLREGGVEVGDVITNPEQAEALRMIARDGAAAFYEGPIAGAIVETIREDGGVLGFDDLLAYEPVEREPLVWRGDGVTVTSMPPPSSGGIALVQVLGVLNAAGVNLADAGEIARLFGEQRASGAGVAERRSAASPHLLVEALKHAFADRAEWLGDPDFTPGVGEAQRRLTSAAYHRELAARIDMNATRPPEAYGSRMPRAETGGTSHFSVVDAAGNAVACTETINLVFGSLLAVERFGFLLNNEMDDFTTSPGEPNRFGLVQSDRNVPQPGKKPLSSMTPTIAELADGTLVVAGGSGGPRIISGTLQVLLRAMAGRDAGAAVGLPRVHHQWLPDRVLHDGVPAGVVESLEARGHEVTATDAVANTQAVIRRADGGLEAGSDPRKGGRPAGG